jgi:modification methylase
MPRRPLAREKRAVAARSEGDAPPLLADPAARVELLQPSVDQPFLRRYVPGEVDVEAALTNAGVLDWRRDAPFVDSIDVVADRVICADARSALERLPANSVACMVTSPPYWNFVDYGLEGQIGPGRYEEYLGDLLRVWEQCERVLRPNGKLCINTPILPVPKAVMPEPHTRFLVNLSSDIETSILQNLTLRRFSLYIWQKQTTEKMFGSYPYPPNLFEQNTVEFISVLVKPGRPPRVSAEAKEASRLTEREWLDLTRQVWPLYPEDIRRSQHPAPFPEALPNRLIAMYAFARAGDGFAGDLVLDPFNGTGATCVAAKRLGRRYIGIDLSPHFCLAAAERLRQARRDGRVFVCGTRPTRRSADEDAGSPPTKGRRRAEA